MYVPKADPLDQFRGTSLQPESSGLDADLYRLTNASVSPVRVIGRDKIGMPIEETVPACGGQKWVHPCGAINNVPMYSGPSGWQEPEHQNYRRRETARLVCTGWLPLEQCPYTSDYAYATGTRYLVANPDKIEDCGGHPDGCEHLQPIIEERTRLARARHDEEQRAMTAMTPHQAANLARDIRSAMALVESMAGEDEEERPAPRAPKRPGDRMKGGDQ